MASKLGHNAFTVQESVNMDVFSDWNYQQLDMSGGGGSGAVDFTLTYPTSSNPAKKIVIYDTDGTMDDDDQFIVYLNGETDSQKGIVIDGGRNLPFTITGLLITNVQITLASGLTDASDVLDVISFH